jgi:ferric-dicitrate binding protein FerR (iron transport regulator)
MEDPKRLAYLFYRYYEKKCTQSEKDELFALLQDPANDETSRTLIDQTLSRHNTIHEQSPESADRILEYITRHQPPVRLRPFGLIRDQAAITQDQSALTSNQTSGKEERPAATGGEFPAKGDQPNGTMESTIAPVVEMMPVTRRRRLVWTRYAAAILLVAAGVGYMALYKRAHHGHETFIATTPPPPPITDQCITLSDGSKVLLHKNAHIEYKPVFGDVREVTLTGEAYFDIRHDARPFIVHTGNITTTVLGTAFNIDAHEKGFVITVVKGKVKVQNNNGDFSILKRNEQAVLDVLHNRLTKTQVDAGEIISWKKPYLLFNDVSMKEAIAELDQRFHTHIILANPALENCHVSANFTQGEVLEQIIKVLSKINNMEYKVAATGSYILSGEGCSQM